MGLAIGYEIACYLAQLGDGLICDVDDAWWRVDGHVYVPWFGRHDGGAGQR